jgi:hypothetical protein
MGTHISRGDRTYRRSWGARRPLWPKQTTWPLKKERVREVRLSRYPLPCSLNPCIPMPHSQLLPELSLCLRSPREPDQMPSPCVLSPIPPVHLGAGNQKQRVPGNARALTGQGRVPSGKGGVLSHLLLAPAQGRREQRLLHRVPCNYIPWHRELLSNSSSLLPR